MSPRDNTENPSRPDLPTDIGPPPKKLFGGTRACAERRDLSGPLVVAVLAEEVATGPVRRATNLSLDEIRALARLAYAAYLPTVAGAALVCADTPDEKQRHMQVLLEECQKFAGRFAGKNNKAGAR